MNDCQPKHAGARNEMTACVWLLNRGYEVFRNVSQHGDIDLIAKKAGEIMFLDVKAVAFSERRNRLNESAVRDGVKILSVFPDGTCEIEHDVIAKGAPLEPRACGHCREGFTPRNSQQDYCSRKCSSRSKRSRRK